MTTLNNKLQLALLKRKKARNKLEKGFTLVELMIVIVIVGILSAVALPNFLNQTGKAKATEAQTNIAAALKAAGAEWHTGTLTTTGSTRCNEFTPATTGNWTYNTTSCTDSEITYQALNNKDFGAGKTGKVEGKLNPSTGAIAGITFSTS